ncbi:6-phosphogluconolactonase [Polymorphobacter multimanifer]|uniref:6-phosphogluconolactonase n=1 Tax=Polymorphobacter multimanifer TaxID=1070431 RepID=UPI001663D442|nr:6-phosphogluconolactonase [Polymorphobacter multimanifer]GGI83757.1 6-phosphogluconolactonase [Polymorphobacter multimanifer]
MIDAEWWDYEDEDELAEAVAGDVAFLIEQALEARGRAFVAFPGGNTPLKALKLLSEKKIEWADVTIVPTDERLVPPTDPASNVGMLAKLFLPRKARVVPLATGEKDPRAAGLAADERLAALAWPLDLAWLGVGADGHVASIFPGPDYDAALNGPKARRALGVRPEPMPEDMPHARVTLTKPALVSARVVTLMITGKTKRKLVEKALKDGASSPMPIGRLLADLEMDIDIHWCA